MFLNCSNHCSVNWGMEQKKAAESWGEIADYAFPAVDADADEQKIDALAEKAAAEIISMHPEAVMCQGEFTLTYALVSRLKEAGILVLAACSERKVVEELLQDGEIRKTSGFVFVRFRRY